MKKKDILVMEKKFKQAEIEYNKICEIIKTDKGLFEKLGEIRICIDSVDEAISCRSGSGLVNESIGKFNKIDKYLFGD